jgi:hypothetical protein
VTVLEQPDEEAAELLELSERHEKLKNENEARIRHAGQKYHRGLVEADLKHARFQHLLEYILPTGTIERLRFEVKWQEYLVEQTKNLMRAAIEAAREAGEPVGADDGLWLPPSADKKLITPA